MKYSIKKLPLIVIILLSSGLNLHSSKVKVSEKAKVSQLTKEAKLREQFNEKLKTVGSKILETVLDNDYTEVEGIITSLIGEQLFLELKTQVIEHLPLKTEPKENRLQEAIKIFRSHTPEFFLSKKINRRLLVEDIFESIQEDESNTLTNFFYMLSENSNELKNIIKYVSGSKKFPDEQSKLNKIVKTIAFKSGQRLYNCADSLSKCKTASSSPTLHHKELEKLVKRSGIDQEIFFLDSPVFQSRNNFIKLPIEKYNRSPKTYNGAVLHELGHVCHKSNEYNIQSLRTTASILSRLTSLKLPIDTMFGFLICATTLPPLFHKLDEENADRFARKKGTLAELRGLSSYFQNLIDEEYLKFPYDNFIENCVNDEHFPNKSRKRLIDEKIIQLTAAATKINHFARTQLGIRKTTQKAAAATKINHFVRTKLEIRKAIQKAEALRAVQKRPKFKKYLGAMIKFGHIAYLGIMLMITTDHFMRKTIIDFFNAS